MNVPVLYLLFNRPDHTRQSFEALRKIKPAFLYIGADGPRDGNEWDVRACAEVRNIVKEISWPCEVKTLYREKNLGTKYAVSSAIDWFFSQVEEGIVMEDDCIPHLDFYRFVAAMLGKYRDNPNIMQINGTNLLQGKRIVKDSSYYFSNFCHPWGWATWKRAWLRNDIEMKDFPEYPKEKLLQALSYDPLVMNYWYSHLSQAYKAKTKSWDYQWFFAFWKNNGIAITPARNMVTNIGFDELGTNTFSKFNRFSKMKSYAMKEIIDPKSIIVNQEADRYASLQRYKEENPSLWVKVRFKLDLIKKNFNARQKSDAGS
jgi:hypothetical protein